MNSRERHSAGAPSGAGHSGRGNSVDVPATLGPVFASIDQMAKEIYARLHAGDCPELLADPHGYLLAAAESVVNSSGVEHDMIRAAMGELSQSEREALLLHSEGADYAQIAQQQGKTSQIVLGELTRAYSRLCVEVEALDGIGRARLQAARR